jgi:4-amino-4-deoxy-L-arabinose transferase-like glycosyltransferase
MQSKTVAGWLAALIAVYALYFWGMAERGLIGPDEPRYASVAHEMAVSGDWVTPRLQAQPWFEKPALLYWLGAAAESLGLGGDRATRWPVALLSALFLLYFYRSLSDAFGAKPAACASMILATSAGWVAFSQAGIFDMPLTVTLGTALLALLPWIEDPAQNAPRRHLIFGAFLGLSVLAKGLVGPVLAVLALAPLLADAAFRSKAAGLIRSPAPAAFLLVSVPWYALCYFANGPVFLEEFIWKHHFERFVSDSLRHVQPFWFFAPVVLAGLLPWTPLLALLHRLEMRGDRRLGFLALWAATAFVFFSLSTNKLPGYVLPVLPPLAALMGIAVARSARPVVSLTASALLLLLIPVGATLLPEGLAHGLRRAWPPENISWIWVGVAFAAACTVAATASRKSAPAALAALAAFSAVSFVLLKAAVFPALDQAAGARPLWLRIEPQRAEICIGDVPRHVRYGLQYYSQGHLPDCSSVQRPFQVESDPPRIVPGLAKN